MEYYIFNCKYDCCFEYWAVFIVQAAFKHYNDAGGETLQRQLRLSLAYTYVMRSENLMIVSW